MNVQDMERAVSFWCAALGYRRRDSRWDPGFMMLEDPAGSRVPLSVQIAEGAPMEPVRLHLDLYTDDQRGHVERLVRLGATRATDWSYPENADFVVLRDPDGNEFCVINHAELA